MLSRCSDAPMITTSTHAAYRGRDCFPMNRVPKSCRDYMPQVRTPFVVLAVATNTDFLLRHILSCTVGFVLYCGIGPSSNEGGEDSGKHINEAPGPTMSWWFLVGAKVKLINLPPAFPSLSVTVLSTYLQRTTSHSALHTQRVRLFHRRILSAHSTLTHMSWHLGDASPAVRSAAA